MNVFFFVCADYGVRYTDSIIFTIHVVCLLFCIDERQIIQFSVDYERQCEKLYMTTFISLKGFAEDAKRIRFSAIYMSLSTILLNILRQIIGSMSVVAIKP